MAKAKTGAKARISPAAGRARIDEPTGTETVGHEWDGIEELNTPLPRWWLWTFYLCILFAIGYVVVYPAIPLLSKGTEGFWGWTSRGQLAQEQRPRQGARGVLHLLCNVDQMLEPDEGKHRDERRS